MINQVITIFFLYLLYGFITHRVLAENTNYFGTPIKAYGKCVAVESTGSTDQTNVLLSNCNYSFEQLWYINTNGTITGKFGYCLDVAAGAVADQTNDQVLTCTSANNQQWTVNDNGTITDYNGKCLDTGSSTTGSSIRISTCIKGNTNQLFTSTPPVPIKVYDKCLQAQSVGVVVKLQDCNGSRAQYWYINLDGTITTTDGDCLDVSNGNTADGTAVLTWPCHGDGNQQWTVGASQK